MTGQPIDGTLAQAIQSSTANILRPFLERMEKGLVTDDEFRAAATILLANARAKRMIENDFFLTDEH